MDAFKEVVRIFKEVLNIIKEFFAEIFPQEEA